MEQLIMICMVENDLSNTPDQGAEATMDDATGNGPHLGGYEQSSQPDQEQLPNMHVLSPDCQEGQFYVQTNQMDDIIARNFVPAEVTPCQFKPDARECPPQNHQIIGLQASPQEIVSQSRSSTSDNHGYDTAKKLSGLKPDDIDVPIKTLCSPGGELNNGTKTLG